MATELYVFVLVRVIVNAPLVRASLVRITHTGTRTRTRVNVNAALHLPPDTSEHTPLQAAFTLTRVRFRVPLRVIRTSEARTSEAFTITRIQALTCIIQSPLKIW